MAVLPHSGLETALAPARIRQLEALAYNAWPALQTVLAEGWVIRFSEGYTKRANSAAAFAEAAAPVRDVAPFVEDIYARHGIVPTFRSSPLTHPDDHAWLLQAGYSAFDQSIVMTADLSAGKADQAVSMLAEPSQAWLEGFAAGNRYGPTVRPTLERMLAAIRPRAAYATLVHDGRSTAYGLAVNEREWVGLFDILVEAPYRGLGQGQRLVQTLLDWGRRQNATHAYLQVTAGNETAIKLYRKLGFEEAYRYQYYQRGN